MPADGAPLFPVESGLTTRRRHITGTAALNIPDPWDFNGGDWHMSATWFWTEPETLKSCHFTDDETYGVVFERLGAHGVRDARRGPPGTRASGRRQRRPDLDGRLRPSRHRDRVGRPSA